MKTFIFIFICFVFYFMLSKQGKIEQYLHNILPYGSAGILPLKVYKDLNNPDKFRSELHRIGGVYGLVNVFNSKKIKQYIGSSKDLYQRLMDLIKGRKSNMRLLPFLRVDPRGHPYSLALPRDPYGTRTGP